MLAAERATADDLDRLEELIERMAETTGDFEEYRRADVRFHIGLAEAAHSPRLVTAMTEVQGQMSDLIARIAHPDEVLTQLERPAPAPGRACCASGDTGRAVRLMREHIEGTEHILAGLMPA